MTEIQQRLSDFGAPLAHTTFVVVDLETTGGSSATEAITEIGAVKTVGGEVIGEFATLVDPGRSIPPMIVALTGITDVMVMAAPRIEAVLPSFLEFLGDGVLVAHNAPFDVGFLKAACRNHGYSWPGNEVVDTVTLARRATTKEEAPNKKLSTLARVFGTTVQPNHRALADARATSEVLHALLERVAAFGITHREDLATLRNPMPEKLRRKAIMADAVPAGPGVYVFRGPLGERLYVGTSKNLRSRVKSYFTQGEQRRSIRDMLEIAVSVDAMVCPTQIEASVREVRLIAHHRPRYNRRSARPERTAWVRLTDEAYPRLSVSRSSRGDDTAIGPFHGAADARAAISVLEPALNLRTCTTRLPATPRINAHACLLKDLGACSAPCVLGAQANYGDAVDNARRALTGDSGSVVETVASHITGHADALNFERAGELRDGLSSAIEATMRAQRLSALRRCSIIAAAPAGGRWDVVRIHCGRLTGSASVTDGVWAAAHDLSDAATTADGTDPLVEEQEMLARWLETPGIRLLVVDGEWSMPVAGAGRHAHWVSARRTDRDHANSFSR